MKPHIRLRYGIWGCVTLVPRVIGCGFSPREAYAEWRSQVRAW
jgi:hypothetical protein